VKRLLDILVSAVALVLLSPLLAVVALLVRLKLGSPVLFRQRRPGRGGQPFELVKFRTMLADTGGGVASDADRLTPFGRALRATSLDELPELWNVLRGDMSLVGPRPLLMQYLDRYSPRQARRHEVRPGLTGWAQINGRNALSWEEKFELDVWYVENRSFLLDLKILGVTALKVLRPDGISGEGAATMSEFMGSAPKAVEPEERAE
jgi:lipopolysaccharide/colanic/teichoic acid biosynthesis glycosyltransferase